MASSPQPSIAFVCAMPMELDPVVEKLSLSPTAVDGVALHAGALAGRPVVAIVTGMGLDLARAGVEALLNAVPVELVVVVGITGALEDETPIGTLVLPAVVVNSRTGTEYSHQVLGDERVHGRMLTTDGLTTDAQMLVELRAGGVVALDMETAAIAEACETRGVAWTVFRVISDRPADGIDQELFQTSNMDGTINPDAVKAYFAKHPEKAAQMAEMGKNATLAASTAADAGIRAVEAWVAW